MKTKKITLTALLIAIGVYTGSLIYIPIGASKCFPIQHLINVIAGVTLGPGYAVATAFCISFLRNILGVGSFLAFPGSMIGAFLSAIAYGKFKTNISAVIGEVVGTGILGGIVAYPVAKLLMGKDVAVFFFVVPFLISTIGGSLIAYVLLRVLESTKVLKSIEK